MNVFFWRQLQKYFDDFAQAFKNENNISDAVQQGGIYSANGFPSRIIRINPFLKRA